MKYMKWTIMMTVLLVFAMFAGCTGGAQENDRQQPADQAARKKSDLRKYSHDKDKQTEDDFDLIGQYVQAEDDQMTIKIKDRDVIIPKSKRFKNNEDYVDLMGKLVKVEVDGKSQEAEEIELMPQSKADENGVYEQEKDGSRKIVATLVDETDKRITVKTKAGNKTYQKTADFERDIAESPDKLKGKTVRLSIQKDGKAESLDFEAEDQHLDWYKQ
ncbi:conotoxin [Bacillus glycinifermentans]|uniref:conotoxin n=1 Tax=Bacillus glycinifermentans TaxID=1664069 RepID=UPI0022E92A67|nr:conotoxin [Bacillus glycinifermentans]